MKYIRGQSPIRVEQGDALAFVMPEQHPHFCEFGLCIRLRYTAMRRPMMSIEGVYFCTEDREGAADGNQIIHLCKLTTTVTKFKPQGLDSGSPSIRGRRREHLLSLSLT